MLAYSGGMCFVDGVNEKQNEEKIGYVPHEPHFLYSVNQSKFIQFSGLYLRNLSDASHGRRDKLEQ